MRQTAKAYGLPYMGSKNQIAEFVCSILGKGDTLYDLFGGGCAITDCAMRHKSFKNYIVNDINTITKYFEKAVRGVALPEVPYWVSRAQFKEAREHQDAWYEKLCYSFGNDCYTYYCNPDKEMRQEALFKYFFNNDPSLMFQWYTLRLPTDIGLDAKKSILKKFHFDTRMEVELRMNRIAYLERKRTVDNLLCLVGDYRQVPLVRPGVIYCDIPYKDTAQYNKGETIKDFDYEAFYDWACRQTLPIYISSYEMPEDRFKIVARVDKISLFHAGTNELKDGKQERIWCPKNQVVPEIAPSCNAEQIKLF